MKPSCIKLLIIKIFFRFIFARDDNGIRASLPKFEETTD